MADNGTDDRAAEGDPVDRTWPEFMGPEEDYILPEHAGSTPPRVVYIGPLTHNGIQFHHVRAEEFTDGKGYAPNPFGRWTCRCGWSTEQGMIRPFPSLAMSPEAVTAYIETRNAAVWHADRCPHRSL